MKKLFLAFVVSFLSIVSIYAVPAYPGLITTTQPDGTTISYYLRGDESFSFKMSESTSLTLYFSAILQATLLNLSSNP